MKYFIIFLTWTLTQFTFGEIHKNHKLLDNGVKEIDYKRNKNLILRKRVKLNKTLYILFYNDTKVAHFSFIKGVMSFSTQQNSKVSVYVNYSKHKLNTVSVFRNGKLIDSFEYKKGNLIPIKCKTLKEIRKNVGELTS